MVYISNYYILFFRYVDGNPVLVNVKRVCNHNGPTYRCDNIAVSDVRHLRSQLFKTKNKIDQDTKLCHFMSVVPIDTKRRTRGRASRSRNFSVNYFLPKRVSKIKIQVCQAFFFGVCKYQKG